MLRRTVVATAVLALAASANATIHAHGTGVFDWMPETGTPCYHFWLDVYVTDTPGVGPDDWCSAGLVCSLTGPVTVIREPTSFVLFLMGLGAALVRVRRLSARQTARC